MVGEKVQKWAEKVHLYKKTYESAIEMYRW
jgi:hypothetical protein